MISTTWVLLDNVGRLWYIDELTNVKKDAEGAYDLGEDYYLMSGGMSKNSDAIELQTGKDTYSVFVVRELVETPLYDKFLNGDLGITYHFSDISYAGQIGIPDAGGGDGVATSPMFFFSLYDFNTGREGAESQYNELYLYVQNREWQGQGSNYMPIYSKGSLYELGNTGTDYFIATINKAEYISGLNETSFPVTFDPGTATTLEPVTLYFTEETYSDAFPTAMAINSGYNDLSWEAPDGLSFDHWELNGEAVDPSDLPPLEKGLVFTAIWGEKKAVECKPGESLIVYNLTDDTDIFYPVYPDAYGDIMLPTAAQINEELGLDIGDDLVLYWTDSTGRELTEYEIQYGVTYEEGVSYIFEVRKAYTDAEIVSITVDVDYEEYKAEKQEDGTWIVKVPQGTVIENISIYSDIEVIPSDGATCEPWSDIDGPDENGVFEITVTAEDGTQKTHKLFVVEEE